MLDNNDTGATTEIWVNFKCGPKHGNRRMRYYPQIALIEEIHVDGLKMHMFTSISEPTLDTSTGEENAYENKES
jgi:hypothetical protein